MKNKAIWFKAAIFLGATTFIFSFQNCSNVRFSQSDSQNRVVLGGTTPDRELDPISLLKGTGRVAPASEVPPGNFEFIFLIDNSYSNKVNAGNIVSGLRNFFLGLPKEQLKIAIYFIGDYGTGGFGVNHILETTETQPVNINPDSRTKTVTRKVKQPNFSLERLVGQTDVDFQVRIDSLISNIQNKLNESVAGGMDMTPHVFEEMHALLGVRKNTGSQNRTVFLLVTDEDVKQDPNKPIYSYRQYETIERLKYTTDFTYVTFKVSRRYPAEGGGSYDAIVDTTDLLLTSCQPAVIEAAIKNLSYTDTAIPETRNGSCKTTIIPARTVWSGSTNDLKFTFWNGLAGTSLGGQKSAILTAKELLAFPAQPQTFAALFSITPGSAQNPDQEASVMITKMLAGILPVNQTYFGSIMNPNFTEFVGQVSNFKKMTDNNFVIIDAVLAKHPGRKIKVIELRAQLPGSTQFRKVEKFQLSGNKILLLDAGIDLANGANVEFDYELIP